MENDQHCAMGLERNIKLFRQHRKLSQQGLASRAGISQTTVSDIERGRNRSSIELPAIAKALRVSVDDLLHAQIATKEDVVDYLANAKGGVAVKEGPVLDPADEDDDSDLRARMLALQAAVLAVIRQLPYSPNLQTVLSEELSRSRDIMAANPIPDRALEAFDDQAEAIKITVDTHHSRRS